MAKRERLVLVDGNALVHRAFHAIGPLTTTSGELTNATFGFTSMLLTALQSIKPVCVAVAFDMAAPTFRKLQFDAYKAHRERMPDELAGQFVRVRQVVEALGIPIHETPSFEADDVLGTLSLQAVAQGLDVVIVTGDLDALQLVDEHTTVFINRRGVQDVIEYDPALVVERYGFPPPLLPDFKALVGDKSDNIPNVPGVGEKTASDLIKKYGPVEELLAHLDELKPKQADLLRAYTEQIKQSKALATIRRDAPVSFERDQCVLARYNREHARALLQELEFRSLLGKLPAVEGEPAHEPAGQASLFPELATLRKAVGAPDAGPVEYHIVQREDQLREAGAALRAAPALAFDVETTAADAIRSALVGISVSPGPQCGYYFPVGHRATTLEGGAPEQLPVDVVIEALKPQLEDPAKPKYAHNAKFDITVLARNGIRVQGLAFDSMVAAYLLNLKGLGLKELAQRELGVEMTQITDLIGTGSKQISMADVAIEAAGPYACADVDLTYRLVELMQPQLEALGLDRLNREIEVPLIEVLAGMELEGVAIDHERLQAMSRDLGGQLLALEQEITRLAGHPFNINSTQQLGKVLFDELKLPTGRRTQTGYSTSSDVLEGLRGKHPIVDKVLEYRELIKLKSTYVDGLPELINPETGRVHTSFNQTVAATGRLSSSGPNLQNIPVRTAAGRAIRQAFIPGRPGWVLLAADYSQVELRVLAHLSGDPALRDAFLADQDIHAATAGRIFGVAPDAVTPHQRRIAKVINFGILYGMGGQAVARQGEVSRAEADTFIADYFASFPSVRGFIEQTKSEAAEQGYVSTVTGRRRAMPELRDPRREIRAQAERAAVNAPVQGSAADIIKVAMVQIFREIRERRLRSRMILQVHDELVFIVPEDELPVLIPLVTETMEQALEIAVPLKVEAKVGPNWASMRPAETVAATAAAS